MKIPQRVLDAARLAQVTRRMKIYLKDLNRLDARLHPLIKQLAMTTPWSPSDWARAIRSVISHEAYRRQLAGEISEARATVLLTGIVADMDPETFDPWIAAEAQTCKPFVSRGLAAYLEGQVLNA